MIKVASSEILNSTPVKRNASQAEDKDLAVRGSAAGYILEEITGKPRRHYFSLILDVCNDLGRNTIKGKIYCS